MKEITLRVADELTTLVEQWAEYVPGMEVVDTKTSRFARIGCSSKEEVIL